jgi:hypothetical protein
VDDAAERSGLRWAIRVGLAVLVLGFLALAVVAQVGHLPRHGLRFAPLWLVLGICGFTLLQLAHAGLWRLILQAFGYQVAAPRSRAIFSTSLLARYVPTSLLMVYSRMAMGERVGVPRRVTFSAIVYELVLALGGAITLGAYFVVSLPQLAGDEIRFGVLLIPVGAAMALHPKVFTPVANRLLRRTGREPLRRPVRHSTVLALMGAYALSFVLAGLATFAVARAIHPVHPADIPTVVGAFAIGYAASLVGFVLPAGLGAREAGFVAALTPVMPVATAVETAVAVRLLQMAIEVVFALVTPIYARRAEERRKALVSASDAGEPIS